MPRSPRRYRVVGSLGGGFDDVLVADELLAGGATRRVLLSRPEPPSVTALPVTGATVQHDVLATSPPLGVARWPGPPLSWLQGVLTRQQRLAVVSEAGAIVSAARVAGVGHGGLDLGCIHVDGTLGRVAVSGFSGRDQDDDLAFVALVESLFPGDDDVNALLAERHPEDQVLDALVARLRPAQPVSLVGVVGATPNAGAPAGEIAEMPLTAGAPPKVQVAAIGAVTLLLGGLTTFFLVPRGSMDAVRVQALDAERLEIVCGDVRLSAGAEVVWVPVAPVRCTVDVLGADGTLLRGTVDARRAGSYLCSIEGGEVRCSSQ